VTTVYREGDALYAEGERSPKVELKAESGDHFAVAARRCAWSLRGTRGQGGVDDAAVTGPRAPAARSRWRGSAMWARG